MAKLLKIDYTVSSSKILHKLHMGGKFMKFRFNHFNFNVMDYEKSLEFYRDALGLEIVRTHEAEDGSFKLFYLGDENKNFTLELTWLRDREEKYDLGDEEFHLALTTDDYEGAYKKHKEMDVICYENPSMGIYFVNDPDGYWVEIVPERKR